MKTKGIALLLSCVWQQAIAQPPSEQTALEPAFISYLVAFGEQPELFDAANHALEQKTHQQTRQSSHQNEQTATKLKEIKQ